jgi:hypothetical protein
MLALMLTSVNQGNGQSLFGIPNPYPIQPYGPGSPVPKPLEPLPNKPSTVTSPELRFLVPRECPRRSGTPDLCQEATSIERQLKPVSLTEIAKDITVLGVRAHGPDLLISTWWALTADAIKDQTGGLEKTEAFQDRLSKATISYVCRISVLASFVKMGGRVLVSHTTLNFRPIGQTEVESCANST